MSPADDQAYLRHWAEVEERIKARGGSYEDTVLEIQTVQRIRKGSERDPNDTQRIVTDDWRQALELEQREVLVLRELADKLTQDLRDTEGRWISRCLQLLSLLSSVAPRLGETQRAQTAAMKAVVERDVVAYRRQSTPSTGG